MKEVLLIMVYQIHIHKIKCPICNQTGKYHKTDFEVICECGYVLITPYSYVAGKKLNTSIELQKEKK